MDIAFDELENCLRVLQRIADDPALMNEQERFKSLVAKIHKAGKKGERRAAQSLRQTHDRDVKADTILAQTQQTHYVSAPPFVLPEEITQEAGDTNANAPAIPATDCADASVLPSCSASEQNSEQTPSRTLLKATRCYICRQPYTRVHHFYHLLCPDCADFNYAKRGQRADLSGRVALVTGGRIKIGFQVALRLLRDGASVIVTTRFPHDALSRLWAEPDSAQWRERLRVVGLDLRNLPAVEAFAQTLLDTLPHLDILIHNAAQTIQRPPAFYEHLRQQETEFARQSQNGEHPLCTDQTAKRIAASVPSFPSDALLPNANAPSVNTPCLLPAALALVESADGLPPLLEWRAGASELLPHDINAHFPPGVFDADGQALDARPVNSWSLKLEDIGTGEMLQTHLVNAVAPFTLNSRLKPLLLRSPHVRRFIVNVSAMEGQFGRASKTPFHPHTNMAKAALNMLTRTCAGDYAHDGIYMNSVDTGWITDENPLDKRVHLQESTGFYTPLDQIDGAARIYDPIAQGVTDPAQPLFGYFLKDYAPHSW